MREAIKQLEPAIREQLRDWLIELPDHVSANEVLCSNAGIEQFFNEDKEFLLCKEFMRDARVVRDGDLRREYGDFQTPLALTDKICAHLVDSNLDPTWIVEPTFGRGSFLISALKHFPNVKVVCGVEIYEPYVWFSKFRILQFALKYPKAEKPVVRLYNDDVFHFDFHNVAEYADQNVLLIGNPPWVTNAELGSLNSNNLPAKRNLKGFGGLDAVTGSSNFDISEYIILMLLEGFSKRSGHLAMLVKNTVIKNLVHDLPEHTYNISNITSYSIDAKKHFDAAVEASLLTCRLGAHATEHQCEVRTLGSSVVLNDKFGWVGRKFVAHVSLYNEVSYYDHESPLVWRQGLKHDCAKVMELTPEDGKFVNGFQEELELEGQLLYDLAKSSDLTQPILSETRKVVIVTQSRVGEETTQRLRELPMLFSYLQAHEALFRKRKSSIYRNKPPFSIFGIGDYSFKPFKVAISGLYKQPQFCLVLPQNHKPVMLDDTCYFLGFDDLDYAIFVWATLNSQRVRKLLEAIVFKDAKRPYTKKLLMRVDLARLANDLSYSQVQAYVRRTGEDLLAFISEEAWSEFVGWITRTEPGEKQLSLFELR